MKDCGKGGGVGKGLRPTPDCLIGDLEGERGLLVPSLLEAEGAGRGSGSSTGCSIRTST